MTNTCMGDLDETLARFEIVRLDDGMLRVDLDRLTDLFDDSGSLGSWDRHRLALSDESKDGFVNRSKCL